MLEIILSSPQNFQIKLLYTSDEINFHIKFKFLCLYVCDLRLQMLGVKKPEHKKVTICIARGILLGGVQAQTRPEKV